MLLATSSCGSEQAALEQPPPSTLPAVQTGQVGASLALAAVACVDGSECSSGNCVDGFCCDAACGGGADDCEACDVAGSEGVCTPLAAETSCLDDGNPCTRDVCDGSGAACTHPPGNAGAACRAAADVCDAAETCDGTATCPPDAKHPEGTACRSANGDCDLAETCDGASDACPADAVAEPEVGCPDDGNPCTRDVCDGSGTACTHSAGNAGAECRAAADVCDAAETCDGSSSACPADLKLGSDTLCRAAAGGCDLPESCSGSGDTCPPDVLAAPGATCRDSAGDCDVAESCSGADPQCPADAVRPSSHVCRASAGECDVADACDGSGTDCPADVFVTANAPCTPDDNVCTRDICSGAAASCTHPAGNAGAECRPANGSCDVAETCDGVATDCPVDGYLPPSASCRDASCTAGVQVGAAQCSGTAPNCPDAVSEPCDAYSCGPDACHTSCTSAEQCAPEHYCDGSACQPQRADGATCTIADQCTSGQCVDGYCCNAACGGQCEACDVEGRLGVCSAVSGEPHGSRDACDTDGTNCGGSCNGDTRNACTYPGSAQVCRVASCAGSVATFEARCGGDGTCGPLVQQACAPLVCHFSLPMCLGDCTADSDCVSGFFCSGGVCTPKRSNGTACTGANQCASNACVDDVCCNTACEEQCEACDVDGFEGTCSPVVGEPRGERDRCAGDGSACDGSCDGVDRSACSYPGGGTNCRLGSCSAGLAIVAAFCDGSGACPALQTQSCAPFTCGGSACLGDCTEDSDCLNGWFCNANVCTAKRALGETCGTGTACQSGLCVDGVCCNAVCNGQCEACDVEATAGTCTPVIGAPHGTRPACDGDGSACAGECNGVDRNGCAYPDAETSCRDASCSHATATLAASCVGTGSCPGIQHQQCTPFACADTQCAGDCDDSTDCATGHYCSAGLCVAQLAQGEACGSNDQCQSDVCADGFCCDTACDGQCEACDLPDEQGTCSPVRGAPRGGRAACAGTGTCAGSCDGVEARACTFPGAGVTCTPASCSEGIATRAANCDGAGSCATPVQRNCSPYGCGANDCTSTCEDDRDCAEGWVCRSAKCEEPAADGGTDAGEPSPPDAGSGAERDAGESNVAPEPDLDTDGDGIQDQDELGAFGESIDTDGDGIPNERDSDDDGDGIPTKVERGRGAQNDLDRDGVPNHLDRDADGDGIDDEDEATGDADGDGIPDWKDGQRTGSRGGGCEVRPVGATPAGAAWLLLAALGWWIAWRARVKRAR